MLHQHLSFTQQSHPLGPIIFFSYGMTKSGSTLAFELARTALELNGYPQPLLSPDLIGENKKINFVRHLKDEDAFDLLAEVREIGHPIVVKTHTRPDPCVIDMVNQGHARIHATFRDPRDMALSMLDHGRRAREKGRKPFSEYLTLADTIPNIASQLDSLAQWLYRPNCLPLFYDDLAFRMRPTTTRILQSLHLPTNPNAIIDHVLNHRFTQKNKAVRKRFQSEMSESDQHMFQKIFRPLHKHMIRPRNDLPDDGQPVLREGTLLLKNHS